MPDKGSAGKFARKESGRGPGTLALLLIIAMAVLHGCATAPTPVDGSRDIVPATNPRAAFEQAALDFQQQAMQAPAGEASGIWISAADAWIQAERPKRAKEALGWIDRSTLSASDRVRLDLVLADLALHENRLDEAEILLQKAGRNLPAASRNRYDELYAQLIRQLASPASREISRATQAIDGMAYYDPLASVELMRLLENVSSGELAVRAYNPRAERQLTGWLDLALVIRSNLVEPAGIAAPIAAWKTRHPHHLLTESQALDTWLRYRQDFSPPRRVAILLPGSGRLQAAGEAIRDGLLSAYAEHPGGTELIFFPTGDDPQSPIAAYFSALDAGADWIIGPLRRESVDAMLSLAGMSTPVLALNDLPEGFVAPAGLADQIRGMSLSQDDEARAVALHAAASGFSQAMLLAPESAWGERMATAFEAEFLHDDRKIVAALRYNEAQNDHGPLLQRALKIDESKARARSLQNTLGIQVEFEPVRRDDVDVIFMAANSTQARLIRPQLKFHDAGDIPVYATGRVYGGQPDPTRNRDLDGLRFPTTRWQLEHPERDDIPDLGSLRGGNLAALYALGQDAWNILPWLALMNKDPGFRFPGQSGQYGDTRRGTLERYPGWAVFANGRPSRLDADRPAAAGE